jgi:hypothetical protein
MNDPRKPLFPPEDDADSSVEEQRAFAPPDAPQAKIYTPPAERFPPLDPAADEPEPEAPPPPRRRILPNLMTLFFILATLAFAAYFALLWVNPYHPLNPLPPYTPLPVIITATPLPATATPIPTETPILPTVTQVPQAASPVAVNPSALPFALSADGPIYTAGPDDCTTARIAGTVTDAQGAGVEDYGVQVTAQEGDFSATVATGSAPERGPGGFDIALPEPLAIAPYLVQLLDPTGTPLSETYLVVSSNTCAQAVLVVNFVPAEASAG